MVYKKRKLDMSFSKRLTLVERKANRNKPQMKHIAHARQVTLATGNRNNLPLHNIAQGSGQFQRIGNKIRVYRIEFRGICDIGLDLYLLQGHNGGEPDFLDFQQRRGGFLLSDKTNTEFSEWVHFSPTQSAGPSNFKRSRHWKNGLIVRFDGATGNDVIDNSLYITVVNNSGVAQTTDYSVRVWYTDE